MTSKIIIAKRYARALISLSRENIEKVREGLFGIQDLFKPDSELFRLLKHPVIPEKEKKQILARVLEGKIELVVLRLLELLVSNKRIDILPDIAESYSILADQAMGIVRAKVKTTFPIAPAQQEAIKQKLVKMTGKQIVIDIEINPQLLGGLIIQMGDKIIDGSVRGRLKDLRETLLETA